MAVFSGIHYGAKVENSNIQKTGTHVGGRDFVAALFLKGNANYTREKLKISLFLLFSLSPSKNTFLLFKETQGGMLKCGLIFHE